MLTQPRDGVRRFIRCKAPSNTHWKVTTDDSKRTYYQTMVFCSFHPGLLRWEHIFKLLPWYLAPSIYSDSCKTCLGYTKLYKLFNDKKKRTYTSVVSVKILRSHELTDETGLAYTCCSQHQYAVCAQASRWISKCKKKLLLTSEIK